MLFSANAVAEGIVEGGRLGVGISETLRDVLCVKQIRSVSIQGVLMLFTAFIGGRIGVACVDNVGFEGDAFVSISYSIVRCGFKVFCFFRIII